MNDYLSKPVSPGELAAAVEHWLREPPKEPGSTVVLRDEAPNMGTFTPVVFDREGFLSRIMGDEELAKMVVEGFLADMPVQIEKLASAVAAGDICLAEQQSHRIKGASASVGGEALREAAFEMEKAGKAGDMEALKILLPGLAKQYDLLMLAMTVSAPQTNTGRDGKT